MNWLTDGSDGCRRIEITFEEFKELLEGRRVWIKISNDFTIKNVLVKSLRLTLYYLAPADFKIKDKYNQTDLLHKAIELNFDGKNYYYQTHPSIAVIAVNKYNQQRLYFFLNTNLPGEWQRLREFEMKKEEKRKDSINREIEECGIRISELKKRL